MKKGQLIRIHTKDKDGAGWLYGVVYSVFDNMNLYHDEYGKYYSTCDTDNIDAKFHRNDFQITELFKKGQPVFAKKDWLGKYRLERKYYQFD